MFLRCRFQFLLDIPHNTTVRCWCWRKTKRDTDEYMTSHWYYKTDHFRTSSACTQAIWHKVRCKVQGARDSCRLVCNYSHLWLLSVTDQKNKTVWKTKRAKLRVNCKQVSLQVHQLHRKPLFEWRPLMEYSHVDQREQHFLLGGIQ